MGQAGEGGGRSWRPLVAPAALLAAAVLFAVLPYRSILHQFPLGGDAIFWCEAMDPRTPGWLSRVFVARHVIGWRPLTALTFAVGALFPASFPWSVQAVGLAFHVTTGLGVYAAWCALARVRSSAWGVLAAVLFWASPVCEAVVPFVARRSYPLATTLGLAGVVLALDAFRRDRPWTRLAAPLLVLAAVLANEMAFVLPPLLAGCALLWAPSRRRALEHVGAQALVTLVAAGLRLWVLGDVGGYELAGAATPAEVFGLTWLAAVLPPSAAGNPAFLVPTLGAQQVVGGLLAAWALAWTAHRARRGDPVPLVLVAWALGCALLSTLSGMRYLRTVYPMGVPVALWLVWALRDALSAARARSVVAAGLAPLALILAARVQRATSIAGLDREPIRSQYVAARMIRRSVDAVEELEGPALVWVGLPLELPDAMSALYWIRAEAPEGVELRVLTHRLVEATPSIRATLEAGPEGYRPIEASDWSRGVRAFVGPVERRQWLAEERLRDPERATWILDTGQLRALPGR